MCVYSRIVGAMLFAAKDFGRSKPAYDSRLRAYVLRELAKPTITWSIPSKGLRNFRKVFWGLVCVLERHAFSHPFFLTQGHRAERQVMIER